MTLRRQDKTALQIGGGAVIVFLVMQFAVLPVWDGMQENREALPILEKRLEKSRKVALMAGMQSAAASSLEAKLREAEGGLLTSATAGLASAELQEWAKQIGSAESIDIRSNQFLPAKPLSAEYTQVPLGLDFQCRLDQLAGFIARIAEGPKYVAVQKLVIQSGNSKERVLSIYLQIAGVMRAEAKKERSQ